MAQINIENLNFTYPLAKKKALNNISLDIEAGDFVLLCGESGCGKTTLLRQLKKELAPYGEKSGSIYINGKNADEMTLRESAVTVGYVMQNPELQTVTDKVWHELAFGLENLGLDTAEIRLRVAEMASYFGIGEWFNKKTTELSGGQKQIMILASVMAMHPDVLILDEPTSQLDPVAAENFLFTVGKINRELGTTVIITEQRLEEVFSYADRVVVMDNGNIVFDGAPYEAGEKLDVLPGFLKAAAPAAMRIFNSCKAGGRCPVSVREGRMWLGTMPHGDEFIYTKKISSAENAAELKDICFRYEKNGKDILKNISLKIPENSIFAVLGGNGAGKTTLMKILSGVLVPYSGKVKIKGKKAGKSKVGIAAVPQDVQALFTAKTVKLDLNEVCEDEKKMLETAKLLGIEELLDSHPFDLSGGEQQRAAIAKALLCDPEILLLDEPTKGMDAGFKSTFAGIIRELCNKGCTVIMISHDVEFCAKYADYCAMVFDGETAASAESREFFNNNRFYTTSASRMARGIIKNAVTDEDICLCLKEK